MEQTNDNFIPGAAIAQWIRLSLPSCHPVFEFQPHHAFSIYIVQIVYLSFELECKTIENKQKEARFGPFF